MKLTSLIQIFWPFSGGVAATTITPPFRVVAVDAYSSGATQGDYFVAGSVASDSFVAGQQAGQANG